MENVTISVLNECWKSVVLARQRGNEQEVQRIRNSPLCRYKGEGVGWGSQEETDRDEDGSCTEHGRLDLVWPCITPLFLPS